MTSGRAMPVGLADLWRGLVLALAYFAAGKLALLLAIPPGYATAIWPPAGLALAAALRFGPGIAPGIWLGSFLTNVVSADGTADFVRSAQPAALIAVGAAVQALVARALILRATGSRLALSTEREVLRFLALGGPVACCIAATCGVASVTAFGLAPREAAAFSWFTWWIGDTIGVMIFAPLLLSWLLPPADGWRVRRHSLGIPLGVAFVMTVAAFLYASHWERARARADFERQAADMSRAIEQQLVGYVEGFRSISALYESSQSVEREEFHAFVSGMLARHPGIRGVSWHPRVLDRDRERFERAARRAGNDEFAIREFREGVLVPAARRHEYMPVLFIEPGGSNDTMLGYDAASRAERRTLLAAVRDRGELAFSDRVPLPLADAHGVLVYVPVYRNGRTHETTAQRREHLVGFIGGALVLEDVVASALGARDAEGIALWLENERVPTGSRVLSGRPGDAGEEGLEYRHSLVLPGLAWTVHATRDGRYLATHRGPGAWFVLLGGLLLDALLGSFLLILTGRTARVESLVAQRTQQLSQTMDALEQELRERELAEQALRRSESQFRSVSESANEAIVIAGTDGRILRWNQAAQRCFGYSELEALGEPVSLLIPERLRSAHEEALERLRKGAEPRLGGLAMQLPGLRKDGSEIPLEISLSTWCADDETYYCGILRDITERQRADLELQRAKDAAEVGNRAKGDFLANMSHEIRTPMNAVIGMTGLLLDTPLDERQREFVDTIRISGDHLLTVINEILDLSKIESGALELETSVFDLRRCVEEAVDLTAPRARGKQLELRHRVGEEVPRFVSSDAGRLRQVLVNLIDNAIKFTERGDVAVEVAARQSGERPHPCELHFLVRDSGCGIARRDFERLFEPFTQADASVTRRFGGTGLGLTISKRLCERLGGRIWVESEVGRGSTFHFTITARVESRPELAEELAPERRRERAAPSVAPARLRILLAEDNAVNQKVARLLLEQLGYTNVDVAGNGIEVIGALERQRYDVVLMDVQMPEMDGIDATRWIRGRWKRGPKIIAMTAHALAGDRERCLAAGMDGYLAKPVQSAELASELCRVCGGDRKAAPARAPDGRRRLAALTEQIADVAVVAELVDEFAREARAADPLLRDAFAAGDARTARRIAHTLGSTAAMVGASELSSLAREIERLAAAEDAAGARARMEGLVAMVEESLAAVLAERDELVRGSPTA